MRGLGFRVRGNRFKGVGFRVIYKRILLVMEKQMGNGHEMEVGAVPIAEKQMEATVVFRL